MQLRPRHHEPQLPNAEAAFDDLDLIDANLGLAAGVTSMEVCMA